MRVLSFVFRSTVLICPACSWAMKSPYDGGCSCVPGLMSFCAKNASTTTIRIGNAALLKNLLMAR